MTTNYTDYADHAIRLAELNTLIVGINDELASNPVRYSVAAKNHMREAIKALQKARDFQIESYERWESAA